MNNELFPGGRIPISHPGEALREDFLIPLGKDAAWLAQGLRMPLSELQKILGANIHPEFPALGHLEAAADLIPETNHRRSQIAAGARSAWRGQ